MMTEPDILVAGLGPAGACAALAAARSGYNVLGIEKKPEPGTPVQCAEFVPFMLGCEVEELASTRIQTINEMRTWVDGAGPHQKPDFPGQMIDRAAFDRQLGEAAHGYGAKLQYGISIRAVDPGGDVLLSNGKSIRAKVIIGADGPHSLVGKTIGAPITSHLETRQITVPLLQEFTSTDIYLSADIPNGYAWAFPKGDLVNLGLGIRSRDKAQLKALLARLHAQLVQEGRVGQKILSHTGGAIPASGMTGPVGQLGNTLCLLAGDAAGLTNPITGAGINSAVISGQLAARAAAGYLSRDKLAVDDYLEDLQDLFGNSLTRAVAHAHELGKIYHQQRKPTATEMRQHWIAFDDYWKPQTVAATEEKQSCLV